jgi:hypothetical protein
MHGYYMDLMNRRGHDVHWMEVGVACPRIYTFTDLTEPADLRAAPEGAELDCASPENELVVAGSDGSADQRAHPEDPLQIRTSDSEWWS